MTVFNGSGYYFTCADANKVSSGFPLCWLLCVQTGLSCVTFAVAGFSADLTLSQWGYGTAGRYTGGRGPGFLGVFV